MRLISTESLMLESFVDDRKRPKYAILSHAWDEEEIFFADMQQDDLEHVKKDKGCGKLEGTCRQARKDGYDWIWIDSCCIDKSSSAELSEAINAMEAQICYV
ncbi:hypothetical protein LTS14_010101 [Recurvomyces mirabilis]|uniref:uncharacterized protein n=1 Tax=Recurvomyces mirabilis TaxID=574656 RepID=UPI002DDDC625|nr:hypothetical protein LTS14_010101 [Recurvomyces mirabilis]